MAGAKVACDGRSSRSVCSKLFCNFSEILLRKRSPYLLTVVCMVKKLLFLSLQSAQLNATVAFALSKDCKLSNER